METQDDTEKAAACLEALGNPTRLAIYRLLVRAGVRGRNVGHIKTALAIPASTLSHHLKHLEMVGLVQRQRHGTVHMCVAEYARMDWLLDYLARECCADVPADASDEENGGEAYDE